ncbi:hypothetical protein [Maliponia aquimaris]|uniref:Cytochrome c domain-containing protein n=1 Tax=Maliponia aquimaris TaxID=1673631 RepID=A0A238K5F5_9RHOB|nr:hypothetical protein [Maliponia aquimaris]SMX38140.1 hypothetical protein MAA8898_01396 [Maliponia aquimaris]
MNRVLVPLAGAMMALSCGMAQADEAATAALFARACGKCHGADPAGFLSQGVTRTGGTLTGVETGVPVAQYLMSGHGRLTEAEVTQLMALFETLVE